MADFDSSRGDPIRLRQTLEFLRVVHLFCRGVAARPLVEHALHGPGVIEIDGSRRDFEVEEILVAKNLTLAGRSQHDEFVAEVAADRTGVGAHRDRLEAETGEGAQIGGEHAVVGMAGAGFVQIEGIGVLHQEFTAAHHAETRPHLVAELPLDVIEIEWQVLVGLHISPKNLGDHFLVGRAEQHVAFVPVLDAQHLLAVRLVAAGFAPEVGRLDGRHEEFDRAGAVLLLADDGVDLVEHPEPQRQPGIDARRFLADHAGAQHQAVRDDLRLLRIFAKNGQEISGKAHQGWSRISDRRGRPVQTQGSTKHKGSPRFRGDAGRSHDGVGVRSQPH